MLYRKCLLLSLLALSACSLLAQPVAAEWPEFNCASNELVLTFVDLNICTKAGAYSNVQVLAGTAPSIVFEQNNNRFDVLSYEGADRALAGLAARTGSASTGQALERLFSWRGNHELTAQQQALLGVFNIDAATQLKVFSDGRYTAYIRLNADAPDNTIFITAANSEQVYRLIGNFSEGDAQKWLTRLSPTK
ncbi:hypothetical protein WG68_13410 [Arsukibacterium ikkense]|uniref:DUF1795 domain-containing protein n=1 Tax=Arsukibacterium ikkense TaxID=336831 RepID=A0A0M2V5A5_9GAMM|nr:hypothetical protein [Arsukibacterium ikkense]KKO44830.1 hypothetical protein WG68_13410 [Arsukibacterium ikkense]